MIVPLPLLWIYLAVKATLVCGWRWSRVHGPTAVFGLAWEFPNQMSDPVTHIDAWTKDTHPACGVYPVVTFYVRINLLGFVDRPIIDVVDAYQCQWPPQLRHATPDVKDEGQRFPLAERLGA